MLLSKEKLDVFLLTLEEIVSTPGSWREKRGEIKDACSKDDAINLEEFLSWFNEEKDTEV